MVQIMVADLEKETGGEMAVRRVAPMVELWAGSLGRRLVALMVTMMVVLKARHLFAMMAYSLAAEMVRRTAN